MVSDMLKRLGLSITARAFEAHGAWTQPTGNPYRAQDPPESMRQRCASHEDGGDERQ